MSLANPAWLWGLLAAGVPIAIHLLSRKEGKVIRVGSIRFLNDSPTQQFKSIRLIELLLLALRLILIVLLVFILAQPLISISRKTSWLVTDATADESPWAQPIIDSLTRSGYEWHSLLPGIPHHRKDVISQTSGFWMLMEELRTKDFSSAIVLSSTRISGFSGLRTSLPANVTWISIPEEDHQFLLSASMTGDSILVRSGSTSGAFTSFENIRLPGSPGQFYKSGKDSVFVTPADTIRIYLFADQGFERDAGLIEASLHAISTNESPILRVPSPEDADWLVWLSVKPLPPLNDSVQVLRFRETDNQVLLQQEHRNSWLITKRLTETLCLKEQFVVNLASVLHAPTKAAIARALQNDRRVMPDKMLWSPSPAYSGDGPATQASQKADSVLILLLVATLLAERWISYQRRQ